jgi:hypothetical protein
MYEVCPQAFMFITGVVAAKPVSSAISNISDTISSVSNMDPTSTNAKLANDLFSNALEGFVQLLFMLCESVPKTASNIASGISNLFASAQCENVAEDVDAVPVLNDAINNLAENPDNENADDRIMNYFQRYQQNLEMFNQNVQTPAFQQSLQALRERNVRGDGQDVIMSQTEEEEEVVAPLKRSRTTGGKRKTHKRRKQSKRKGKKSRKTRKH